MIEIIFAQILAPNAQEEKTDPPAEETKKFEDEVSTTEKLGDESYQQTTLVDLEQDGVPDPPTYYECMRVITYRMS